MSGTLVVSPHLDDAVLSAGQYLGDTPEAVVVTIMAGDPAPGFLSTYDERSGFVTSAEAMAARRAEDRAALDRLRPDLAHRHLTFLDNGYSPDGRPTVKRIAYAIIGTARSAVAGRLVGPLGLAHPDHLLVAEAFLLAVRKYEPPHGAFVYEELPYRVHEPEAAAAAVARLDGPTLEQIGSSPMAAKELAVAEYRSQAWALDPHCAFAPERFWRIWP